MEERQVSRKLDANQTLAKLKELIAQGPDAMESLLEIDSSYQFLFRCPYEALQVQLIE